MVHSGRRLRRRNARREEFLEAASALAEEHGVEALTMKALAERLDCAVGTAYTYFPSKGALVAAIETAAIGRLADAYRVAAPRIEPLVADLDERQQALARLVALGRFMVAAEREMHTEVDLQRQLLNGPVIMELADAEIVAPAAFELLARPQTLIAEGARVGALSGPVDTAVTFDRAVTWVAAVNGVLSLDLIKTPAAGHFDTSLLVDRLSLDLLRAWGAVTDDLAVAAGAVPADRVRSILAAAAGLEPAGPAVSD